MSQVIPLTDGYGGCLGFRYPMPGGPHSNVAYARRSDVVVEFREHSDHGPQAPPRLLVFGRPAQRQIAEIFACDFGTPHQMAYNVALRRDSYFDVLEFADSHNISYQLEIGLSE